MMLGFGAGFVNYKLWGDGFTHDIAMAWTQKIYLSPNAILNNTSIAGGRLSRELS